MISLEGFTQYLRSEKRYSNNTEQAYLNDLHQFINFLRDNYDIVGAEFSNSSMVRSWVIELMDQGKSPRSVNRKLSTLKTYYKYLLREGKIADNPMSKVISPKTESRLPSYMEKSDMEILLSEKMFDPGYSGQRDRLILMLLYYTGMRRSELINLKINSFDKLNSSLKVLGKGNKERILPINMELSGMISKFIDERKQDGKIFSNDLLTTDKGKTLYPNFVYRVVRDHLARVSTASKRSPHILRHTFATHLLNNGADLNAIKEILGHANLSATQIYTHNSIEKLKQIYNQAHPKA